MKPYILLTPGPLTTSQTVKEAMLTDWCTWDEDYNLHIVEEIRKSLVSLATQHTGDYTSILLQGSGTYCVEAVIGSVIKPGDKLLILSNGAYGDRMGNIAEYHGISYDMLAFDETEQVSVSYVDDYLSHNAEITHVAVVHCETTTGVLNPLKEIAHLVKMHGKKLIVDAMSSFGGVPLDVHELGIDFLISSANKCIQGVPGFGFIIARRSELLHCKGVSKSLSLDIYDQWEAMEKGHGKWRFTSPTHVVRAFKQAMDELAEEGGVEARHNRYCEPPRAGRRHAFPRFPNVAAGRDSIARYYFFPLSSCRFQFQSFLHTTERAWICHLSGKDFASRHFPYRQYRRCSSRRFPAADRDNSRV